MVKIIDLTTESMALSELKDNNGQFKHDDSSEQFAMTVHMQYEVLRDLIKDHGQQVPILIWRKRIVDGRNRCKALNELDIDTVLVKILPHKMSEEERMKLARSTEYGRRHETPTQLACNAVMEYHKIKKSGSKITQAQILSNSPASSANFTSAKYLYDNQPMIFKRLFDGELISLDNPLRPTQSLAAVKAFYVNQEKEMDELKKQLEIDEVLAIDQYEDKIEDGEQDIAYNGKQKIYESIDTLLDPIISNSNITMEEYLRYKFSQMKRMEKKSK